MKQIYERKYLNWYRIGVTKALNGKYYTSIDPMHYICTVLCPNFRTLPFPMDNKYKETIYNIIRCIIYWYPQDKNDKMDRDNKNDENENEKHTFSSFSSL